MIASTFAGVLAIGTFLWSWLRLRHIMRALSFDAALLAKTIRRGRLNRPSLHLLAVTLRRETSGWEADLLDDLARTQTTDEAIAVANEHLHDLASELDWGAAIPSSAARVGLLSPMCILFFAAARGRAPVDQIMALFAWAGVGALGPLWVGRASRGLVSARRLAADELVASCIRATQAEESSSGAANGAEGSRVDPS